MEQTIQKEAQKLIDLLGIDATFKIEKEGDVYTVVITMMEDEVTSQFIGYHADTLNAFQRILTILLFKQHGEKVDILVDVNNYRMKQQERLEGIAENVAQKVLAEGKSAVLQDFSPYERKLIHSYISLHFPKLQSQSEGEGRDRVLRISYS